MLSICEALLRGYCHVNVPQDEEYKLLCCGTGYRSVGYFIPRCSCFSSTEREEKSSAERNVNYSNSEKGQRSLLASSYSRELVYKWSGSGRLMSVMAASQINQCISTSYTICFAIVCLCLIKQIEQLVILPSVYHKADR